MNDDQIRTAFQRLDRDVRTTVRPRSGLDHIHGRRWARMLAVPLAAAAIVTAAVVSGALLLRDSEPPPVATTLPTATTTPTPTTTPSTETTLPGVVPDPNLPAVNPTVVAPGEVLLASPGGVAVARNGEPHVIVEAPARVAVGDRRGGILYESDGSIFSLPANSTRPALRMQDGQLHDVALIDGRPAVIFSQQRPAAEGSVVGEVFYAHLDGPGVPVRIYTSDGYEGGITRVSYGGGIFAITQAAEGFEWFEFVDLDGTPVDVANPQTFEMSGEADVYTDQGVLSPDGTQLAFLQSDQGVVDVGDPIDVVLWDLENGAEVQRFVVGISGEQGAAASFWFVRADFDGRRMVVGQLDRERNALEPIELDLGDMSVAVGPVAGAPSIVGESSPAEPPATDPQSAVIPAEGLGRGVLVATGDRVVWYQDPSDPLAAGGERLIWEFTGDEQFLGADRFAFDDGSGGVVFGGGTAPVRWLRPGARGDEAVVVSAHSDDFPLTLHGVAVIGGAPAGIGSQFDGERMQLLTVDLATGTTDVVARIDAAGGWVSNVSFDGERFWVAAVERQAGGFCTRTFSMGLGGDVGGVSGVPATCTATALFEQARVSPDGRLVAYVESGYAGTEPELGDILRTGPIDLVVADTSSGEEVARLLVGTDVQDIVLIHDFDGERLVVSRQAVEPALSQQVVFVVDLGCGGCSARFDTIAADAGLTGQAAPAGEVAALEPLPGCSTDGRFVATDGQAGLPAAVDEMRRTILALAARCDLDGLDAQALAGEFSHDFEAGFPGMFRQAEDSGSPEVRRIAEVLALPFGTVDAGGTTIYVWPQVATYDSWDEVSVEEKNQLAFVYDFPEQRGFAEFGAYVGLRVGITEAGDWVFTATGD